MIPHYLVQRGGKLHMLVKSGETYHIIAVDKQYTDEKEEILLAGNCSAGHLTEMGLKYTSIPAGDLRGIGIGGSAAGDALVFYLKRGKQDYVFSDDYEKAEVDAFFGGIKRFQPPKVSAGKKTKDWRKEEQVPELREQIWLMGTVLKVVSWGLGIAVFFWGKMNRWLTFGALMCFAALFTVYLRFPSYFTLLTEKDYRRAGYQVKVRHLDDAMLVILLAMALRTWLDYALISWKRLAIITLVSTVLLCLCLWNFSRECREHKGILVTVILTASVFGSFGIIGQINYVLGFTEEQAEYMNVAEMEVRDRRRGEDYYCVVYTENGEELKLPVSRAVYEELKPSDRVPVVVNIGALGLEYAYFDADTYNEEK